MWQRILRQPTAILELLRQAIIWIMVMGWVAWTDVQQLQTIAVASALLAVLNFMFVTPNVSVDEKAEKKASTIARLNRVAPFILLALALTIVACASGGALKLALQAENQVHDGLGRARQRIVSACPETNLSQACSTTKSAFNDVLDAAIAYNRGLANKDLTQGPALVKAIQDFIAKIKALNVPDLLPTLGDVTYAQGGVKTDG